MKSRPFTFLMAALAPLLLADSPKSTDPRVVMELIADAPDIVTPTGLGVDARGRVLVIESRTHFRPKEYEGPKRDRVLMFTPQAKGKAKRTIFYEGLLMGMDLTVSKNGWVYLAERSRILRVRDSNGDGRADKSRDVVVMDTNGTYPHNGLSGLSFDANGNLVFGLGENLGHAYTMIGRDGVKIEGAAGIGGGVFRCTAEGKKLEQIARGFWNPFGTCVDKWGRIFAVDNDPGNSPPCRLLHVVEGGDYGYRYKYGRSGIHPFLAWNGELLGTLPMVHGTGEGPCEVIHFDSPTFPAEYRGRLLVTSWGDQRVETYTLARKGTSVTAKMTPLVQGDDSFRPVGMAMGPDGNLYVSDWGSSSYNLNKMGRLWRIRPTRNFKAPALKPPPYIQPSKQKLKDLSDGKLQPGQSFEALALNHPDPFLRHAALSNIHSGRISPSLHARFVAHQKKHPGKTPLRELMQTEPGILFEYLRWAADTEDQTTRPLIEAALKNSSLNYANFRAALAAIDTLDGRNNPDRFNQKFALPILKNPDTPASLRANVLRYVPDDHQAIDHHQLVRWIQSNHPALQHEAIWKSRTHLNESTHLALRRLALNPKADIDLRLEAIAAIGNSESPDTGTLTELLAFKDPAIRDETLRSLTGAHHEADSAAKVDALGTHAARRALGQPYNEDYPAAENTAAWLQRLDALPGKPDSAAGRRIFFNRKIGTCGRCHQVSERGTRVGPDLTRIGHGSSRKRLLESILQPNKEVSPYLRPWVVTLSDGSTHTGIAMRRGGSAENYLGIDGKEFRLDKNKVVNKQELHTSLMPPGLAHTLTLPELRDLLAFLTQNR